jgi:hypothetical protein
MTPAKSIDGQLWVTALDAHHMSDLAHEAGKAVGAAAERRALMQLFTDPENQPTQHGTVTVEYMQREIAAERNKLAAWMIQFGFATGHGDSMEQLLDALGTEIVDRIDMEVEAEREAIIDLVAMYGGPVDLEAAIRARGQA